MTLQREARYAMVHMLLDNGSFKPEATLSLRRLSDELTQVCGETVHPVSLMHSHRIDPVKLDGKNAQVFLPFVRQQLSQGMRSFYVTPLFFGPSRALTVYIPEQVAELQTTWPDLKVDVAPCLCPGDEAADRLIVTILQDHIHNKMKDQKLVQPRIAMVDHGSPLERVTEVRNRIAARLADHLGDAVSEVSPCSMERRDGPQYDFNEPLLEHLLREPGWREGPVIVAMLFLQPGRHAGVGGDVAAICAAAEAEYPALKSYRTALVGEHPALLDILAQRVCSGIAHN